MPAGTPNFVGGRLREARQALGLTQTAVADMVGVSKAAVSDYEKGVSTPRPEIVQNIIQRLNFPANFFFRPTGEEDHPLVFYRSMSGATKTARLRVETRLVWLSREVLPFCRQYLEFPQPVFPQYQTPNDFTKMTEDFIEEVATDTRRFWGLKDGPISNVVWLLENNGVIVSRFDFEADTLDSFSSWHGNIPFVFLNSGKQSAARSRWDAAHELGHLLLHRNVSRASIGNPKEHAELERQAHRFAGAFLLPTTSFANDVYAATLGALRILKTKWVVSIAAMIRRLEDLGMLSDDKSTKMWINLGRNKWKRREPLDDELPVEFPMLLGDGLRQIIESGILTKDEVLLELPFIGPDLERMTSIPSSFWSDQPPHLRLLDLPNSRIG